MWKNCWKFRSITNFYYIPLLFVCWPLDYLFKTYCWRKEGAFHGKTTRQGSKKKGRSYHHFCAYSKCCTFEFWTKNYFSQRFLSPLAKPIRNCIYALQGCTKNNLQKDNKMFFCGKNQIKINKNHLTTVFYLKMKLSYQSCHHF